MISVLEQACKFIYRLFFVLYLLPAFTVFPVHNNGSNARTLYREDGKSGKKIKLETGNI